MATRNKKKRESLPIRSSSHSKEDSSQDIFRDSIKPWMLRTAISKEYGIDGSVEITKPLSNLSDQIVTGKRFSVQLKSSDTDNFEAKILSLSVPKEKINYWYSSIEPVLLVYIDLLTKSCYYRWIDEELIRELFQNNSNWIAQESITIRFHKEKIISKTTLSEIEKYVINWKRPLKTILTPGNYFKFSQEAISFINLFLSTIKKYNINFLQKETKSLENSVAQTIYTVAIVGPTKAGKSTLINCLLYKEISPVGMLPTTGIPITIYPSNENKVVVLFKDNSEISGQLEEPFLKEYTSKGKNPDNKKNVKLVSVYIINTLLEKGFAICDVPGLDDPDNEIRNITQTALINVNAIIYLVSTGPMTTGDFSLDKQILEDLAQLGGEMDRLFLVFNKIDVLNSELLNDLKEYVNATLEKHGILDYLPTPPIYLSSKKSFDNRVNNDGDDDSVCDLENQLWKYLLEQNKTGLHKIIGSFGDCLALIERHKNIVGARRIDSEKREDLQREIQQISIEINQLRRLVGNKRKSIYSSLDEYLNNSLDNILNYLKTDLENIPIYQSLYNEHEIKTWLGKYAFKTFSDVYASLQQNVYEMQSEINQWISEKLKQVEIGIESPDSSITFKMPDINKYTNQINSYFQDRTTGYIGFFQKIGYIIEDFFEAIENFFTSDIRKRNNQIQKILSKSKRCYNDFSKEYLINLNEYLNNICRFMEEKSIDRSKVYLGELSTQLEKLDLPISDIEKQNFEKFVSEISQIENGIQSNLSHLKAYTDGIDWSQ